MTANDNSIHDALGRLRSSIAIDVKRHVESLKQAGVEFYGYAVLPPDYFTAYDPVSIAIAYNGESDIEAENRDDAYYRYSVDEWQNYAHDGFDATNEVLCALLPHLRDQDDAIDNAVVRSVYQAILDGLVSLREDGTFGDSPFVVVWLSDSDESVINQSAEMLNSPEVYSEYASEFAD